MTHTEAGIEEHIIGYDAREFWQTLESSWSEERREKYLYRLDITKPLSVDARVWPSIFTSEGRPSPPDRFGFQNFWSDFSSLRSAVTKAYAERPLRAYRMIAAVLLLGDYAANDLVSWGDRVPPVKPASKGPDWSFLGYDVADQWGLSALLNCGFVPGLDDAAALRLRWGPLLNQFHLFDDVDAAIAFKQMSDERLKDDHAPCFVFGLWAVK